METLISVWKDFGIIYVLKSLYDLINNDFLHIRTMFFFSFSLKVISVLFLFIGLDVYICDFEHRLIYRGMRFWYTLRYQRPHHKYFIN